MSFIEIVKQLSDEIKGKNRKDKILSYEELLSKEIEELSKCECFFNLPLNNIFSVISKVDFSENDNMVELIQNIIKNMIQAHYEEKETILILQNINTNTILFHMKKSFLS